MRAQTASFLLVLLGLPGVVSCKAGSSGAEWRYESAEVSRGPVVAKVTASGTLSALVTVQVGTQVSGRIQELRTDFNKEVKKGQVLARIDPRLFEAAAEQSRANVLVAKAALARAEVEALDADRRLQRTLALFKQSSVAAAEAEAAQSVLDVARANVLSQQAVLNQSRAALNLAETNLAYTTITSPIDGLVISRSVDVGQTVAASLQAPTLFTIAEDLRKMQVDTSVSEADIGKLKAGLEATFTVDAWPGQRFRGVVREIRNAPQTVQSVVTYDVVIDVDNGELLLKPGMTATVNVIYAQREGVVRVPNAALRFRPPPELLKRADRAPASGSIPRPETGKRTLPDERKPPDARTVWVLKDGAPTPVPVRLGLTDGSTTELLEGGLTDGDALVTEAINPNDKKGPAMGGMRRVL